VPASLLEFGREPFAPLRSASRSSQVAGFKKLTGDPSDPWLMASAARLNWACASSQESVEVHGASVDFSSCWASHHS